MVTQQKSAQEAVQQGMACRHHWVIDTPSGPVSTGVCKVCGEAREFRNYLDNSPWEYDVSLEEASGGLRRSTSSLVETVE